MARQADHPHGGSDMPEVIIVEVTVLHDRGTLAFPMRIAAISAVTRRRAIVALAVVAAAALFAGDGIARQPPLSALARDSGPAGVAAAYGYPLSCLSITILRTDRTYARADFNHLTPCGRYTGYPTAIFHYHQGRWRTVLDVIAYTCPVDWLPPGVQTGLGVCEQTSGQRRTATR